MQLSRLTAEEEKKSHQTWATKSHEDDSSEEIDKDEKEIDENEDTGAYSHRSLSSMKHSGNAGLKEKRKDHNKSGVKVSMNERTLNKILQLSQTDISSLSLKSRHKDKKRSPTHKLSSRHPKNTDDALALAKARSEIEDLRVALAITKREKQALELKIGVAGGELEDVKVCY